MQKTRIEFSINNIIKSALVNLSKKYINNHKFANTIFEIFDYQKVKSIVEEEINACSVVDDTAKRYHKSAHSCGMDNPYQVTVEEAERMGKTPCGRCY